MSLSAGYSSTPLIKKLGIKPAMKLLLLNAPANYAELLQGDIAAQICPQRQVPDFIHLFALNAAAFEKGMKKVIEYAHKNTGIIIWVSWYKQSAGIATDMTENLIRDFALANRLVDIKVCAVSDAWSGLKLVVPVALR
jgi:hypothetical protein